LFHSKTRRFAEKSCFTSNRLDITTAGNKTGRRKSTILCDDCSKRFQSLYGQVALSNIRCAPYEQETGQRKKPQQFVADHKRDAPLFAGRRLERLQGAAVDFV